MMKPERWDIALIPCTKSKNPQATTARMLYKSAGFTLMMKHAAQRTDRILIMSAKYALLELSDQVANYDAYLPTLSRSERQALLDRIWDQTRQRQLITGKRVLSYLPKAYHDALVEVGAISEAKHYARPYKNLNMMALFATLKRETENYGKKPSRR